VSTRAKDIKVRSKPDVANTVLGKKIGGTSLCHSRGIAIKMEQCSVYVICYAIRE
jgi:hypothetical protein